MTILTPFPGTPLLRQLRAEGRLLYERFWDKCTLFDLVFQPKQHDRRTSSSTGTSG